MHMCRLHVCYPSASSSFNPLFSFHFDAGVPHDIVKCGGYIQHFWALVTGGKKDPRK